MAAAGPPSEPIRLSVVVAAWTGVDALRRCLGSLEPQLDTAHDEILVARNFGADHDVTRSVGLARLVDLPCADATVPQLRAAGLAVAAGTVVAFIEDHCICSPGWRDAIVSAHRSPVAGVGGPVDLAAGGRPIDWAVYFSDYARFMPPMASAAVASISGANMTWKREFLIAAGVPADGEVLESMLERACAVRGAGMMLASAAIVVHGKRNSPVRAVRLAVAQARGYAAARVAGKGVGRVAFAAAAGLLPGLLLGRIVAATRRRRRHTARLILALPWLLVLLAGWSFGEAAGYLAGEGRSRREWR